jgi:hypothetical protein
MLSEEAMLKRKILIVIADFGNKSDLKADESPLKTQLNSVTVRKEIIKIASYKI